MYLIIVYSSGDSSPTLCSPTAFGPRTSPVVRWFVYFVANSTVNPAKNRTKILSSETTSASIEFVLWWYIGHLKWLQNSKTASHAISVLTTSAYIVELYWCTETIMIAVSVVAGIIIIIVGVVVVIIARMFIRWEYIILPCVASQERAYRPVGPTA